MNPSRRNFLMKIGAGMIGALVVRPTIDINELFKPTQRQIEFIGNHGFVLESEIVKIELEKIIPKVKDLFERDDLFYSMMKSHQGVK